MSKPWEDEDDDEVVRVEERHVDDLHETTSEGSSHRPSPSSATVSSSMNEREEQSSLRRNRVATETGSRSNMDNCQATTHHASQRRSAASSTRQPSQRTSNVANTVDKVSSNRKQHVSYMKDLFPNGMTPFTTMMSFVSLYIDMLLTIMLTIRYAAHLTVLGVIRYFAKMNTVPAFLLYVICHCGWVFALALPAAIYAIHLTCWYMSCEWLFMIGSCFSGYGVAVMALWESARFTSRCRTHGLWNVLFATTVLSASWSSVLMVAYIFGYHNVVQLAFNVMYFGIGAVVLLLVVLSLVNDIFVKSSSLHSGMGGDTSNMSESDVAQMHRSAKKLFAPQLKSVSACYDYVLCVTGLWTSIPFALTSYENVAKSGNAVPESLVTAWRRTACHPFVRLLCRVIVYTVAAAAFHFDHDHVSQLMGHANFALNGSVFAADKILPNVSRGRSDRLTLLGLVVREPIELSSLLDARVSQEGRAQWKKLEQLISAHT